MLFTWYDDIHLPQVIHKVQHQFSNALLWMSDDVAIKFYSLNCSHAGSTPWNQAVHHNYSYYWTTENRRSGPPNNFKLSRLPESKMCFNSCRILSYFDLVEYYLQLLVYGLYTFFLVFTVLTLVWVSPLWFSVLYIIMLIWTFMHAFYIINLTECPSMS